MRDEFSVIFSDENTKNKFDVSVASLGDIYKSMNLTKDSLKRTKSKSPSLEKPEKIIKEEMITLMKMNNNKEELDYSQNTYDQNVSNLINKSIYEKIKSDDFENEQKNLNEKKSLHPHIHNLFIDMAREEPQNNTQINVKYLRLSQNPPRKKYSHVKNGIINPVKSTYSIKPIADDNKENHKNKMKDFVLEADPVEIKLNVCNHQVSKTPREKNINYYSNKFYNQNDILENSQEEEKEINHMNYVIIGGGDSTNFKHNDTTRPSTARNNFKGNLKSSFSNTKFSKDFKNTNNSNNNQTYLSNKGNYYDISKVKDKSNILKNKKNFIEGKKSENSREKRTLLKKVEQFYSNSKNIFISSDNNLPSKTNLDDLLRSSIEIEKNMDIFHRNVIENKTPFDETSKILKKNQVRGHSANFLLKNSINKSKKSNPKNFKLNFNPEERKKFEEKLEILHIELRNTMDNLNQMGHSNENFEDLMNRWKELTQTLKNLTGNSENINYNGDFTKNLKNESESQNNFNLKYKIVNYDIQKNSQNFQNTEEINNLNNQNNQKTENKNNNVFNPKNTNPNFYQTDYSSNNIGNNPNDTNNYNKTVQFNEKNSINNFSRENIAIYNDVDDVINVLNSQNDQTENFDNKTLKGTNNNYKNNYSSRSQNYENNEHQINENFKFSNSSKNFYQIKSYNNNHQNLDPLSMKNLEFSVPKNETYKNNFFNNTNNSNNNINNPNNEMFYNNSQQGFNSNNFYQIQETQNLKNQSNSNFYNSKFQNTENNYPDDKYNINNFNSTSTSKMHNEFKSTAARTNNNESEKISSNNSSSGFFTKIQPNNTSSFTPINQYPSQRNYKDTHKNNLEEANNYKNNKENKKNSQEEYPENKTNPSNYYENKFFLNKNGILFDQRYTSYDVRMPLEYYHDHAKKNEPSKDRDWYIRAHHLESTVQNNEVIPDDLMNTKYISYYSQIEKEKEEPKRIDLLNDIIGGLHDNVEILKKKCIIRQ